MGRNPFLFRSALIHTEKSKSSMTLLKSQSLFIQVSFDSSAEGRGPAPERSQSLFIQVSFDSHEWPEEALRKLRRNPFLFRSALIRTGSGKIRRPSSVAIPFYSGQL